jgi:hypothetical protein
MLLFMDSDLYIRYRRLECPSLVLDAHNIDGVESFNYNGLSYHAYYFSSTIWTWILLLTSMYDTI